MSAEHEVINATETKQPKRKTVSLSAGEGLKARRLTILARRTRSGGETVVTTMDAKKKTTRGMTMKYASFDLAVAGLVKIAEEAISKGWRRSERAGGFKARPDAFSSIPLASKVTR